MAFLSNKPTELNRTQKMVILRIGGAIFVIINILFIFNDLMNQKGLEDEWSFALGILAGLTAIFSTFTNKKKRN